MSIFALSHFETNLLATWSGNWSLDCKKKESVLKDESTLLETNSSHLKMDDWKTSFLLGGAIFRDYVSFREGS